MAKESIIDGLGASLGTAANGLDIGFGKGGLSISANFNQRLQKKLSVSENNSPLKDLYESETKNDIVFPIDIDDEKYINIKNIKRSRDKNRTTTKETISRNIILPIPSNISPQYSVQYNEQEMGIAGAMASGIAGTSDFYNAISTATGATIDSAKSLGNFLTMSEQDAKKNGSLDQYNRVKDTLAATSLSSGISAIGALGFGGLGAFLGAKVGGVDKVLQGAMSRQGVAINSHMAVLFDNVGFRTFNFNYRFIPRSAKESEVLKDLIKQFQIAMYPSLPAENRFLFEYPDEFRIEFAESIKSGLFQFKRCVLTDMSVNYNGDGVPRFFDGTGDPVVVDIALTFKEVEILTKEDFTTTNPLEYAP
jgi:hypothetical protein